MAAGKFVIAEGVLEIDADTDAAELRMKGFFRDINGKLRDARGRFASEGELAGKEFGDGLERGMGRGGFFSRLFKGIGSGFSAGIGQLRELGSTLRDVGQVFSTAGGFIGSALKIGAFAAAIPIILGVAAALSKLIGLLALLPGVIGFAVAAIAPLIIAFKGFGEVMGAAMTGDMEAFNEGLKKMSPSARAVAREFQALVPILKSLQRSVQAGFFAPLVGHVKVLGQTLIPLLARGLTRAASAWGNLVAGLLDLLRTPPVLEAINALFLSTQRILNGLSPSILHLFGVFFEMIKAGLPFLERMFTALGEGLDKFADFLEKAMEDGSFQKWLEDAFSVMKDLWELTKALGRLLGALFGPTADEGQTFIQNLTDMVDKLTEFFKSDEGIEFLENLVALLRESKPWLTAIADILVTLAEANNDFIDGIAATVQWFKDLDDVIGGWLSGTGDAISEWWSEAVDWVKELGDTIATFVTEKAAAFGTWLSELPGKLKEGLEKAAEQIAFTIGFLIGQAVDNVISLPEKIKDALELFKTRIGEAINVVADFFTKLPGRVGEALSTMWSTVTDWFSRTKDSASGKARGLVDDVVTFVKSLPEKVTKALSGAKNWLVDAGKDALRGLVDGLQSMLGWMVDRAKAIGESLVRGFKRGLGIASPSKVMRDQVGKWILPGVVEGMQATMGSLDSFMGDVQRRITQPMVNVSAPNVSVGGAVLYADFGDGVQRAVELTAARRPDVFAAATDEGRRQRSRQLGARAKA
jgi:phage-related protein